MPVTLSGRTVMAEAHVVRGLESEVILGADFIRHQGLSYDAIGNTVFFEAADNWAEGGIVTTEEIMLKANSSTPVRVKAHKVFLVKSI